MIQLPNNCRLSKISVYPSNWKTTKASLKVTWRIVYRFYDDNLGLQKQIRKQGMNELEDLKERQDATKAILENEIEILKDGYNPIHNSRIQKSLLENDIPSENTPFNQALDMALKSIDVEKHTKEDLTSVSGFIKMAADVIRINGKLILQTPIGEIRRERSGPFLIICPKGGTGPTIPIIITGLT